MHTEKFFLKWPNVPKNSLWKPDVAAWEKF